jgi:hypothetical protein
MPDPIATIELAIVTCAVFAVISVAWLALKSRFRRVFVALSGAAFVVALGYIACTVDAYPRNVERGRQEMMLVSHQLLGKTRPEAYNILRGHGLVAYSIVYRVFLGDSRWPEPRKGFNGVLIYPDVTVTYTLGDELVCATYVGQRLSFVHERVTGVVNSEFRRCAFT